MIDQLRVLQTLQKKGVTTPFFVEEAHRIAEIGLPALVIYYPRAKRGEEKKARQTMIARYGDVIPALMSAAREKKMYIQQYVSGYEVVCGVMEHKGNVVPLMPIEAIPRAHYEAVPWHWSEKQIELCQEMAVRAHRAVRAKQYSCVRCVIDKDKKIYVTGIDQTPPLAQTSLFVQSARAAGFTFAELKKRNLP